MITKQAIKDALTTETISHLTESEQTGMICFYFACRHCGLSNEQTQQVLNTATIIHALLSEIRDENSKPHSSN